MKDLELKIIGGQNLGEKIVSIDDKPVKVKNNKFGNIECQYQTENEKVNIKVYRALDVGGVLWFITQLFFFVISIFGIFDIRRKEKCIVVDFEAEVYLKEENKITLQFNPPQENEKAINVETDLTSKEISNNYYVDTKAKKTLKCLKITKIFLAVASIITAIVVMIIKF